MPTDEEVLDRLRELLREWGWETGYRRLVAALAAPEDEAWRDAKELFLGWMAAELGSDAEAVAHFEALPGAGLLGGLGRAGRAFVAMRRKEYDHALQLLDAAAGRQEPGDRLLPALVAHLRGAVLYHQGDSERARPLLLEALTLFGPDHAATGRVLDTLGMIYAGKDNFHAAREFYLKALANKERAGDQAGLALSHGQLGRLYFDWGRWDRAEDHANHDLAIAQRMGDESGQAQMEGLLGRIALARGEEVAAMGRGPEASRLFETAAGWIDASLRRAAGNRMPVAEGFACKDRALVHLAERQVDDAARLTEQAAERFGAVGFEEGLAHVNRLRGTVLRERGRHVESRAALRAARRHFEEHGERAEVAQTQLQIARTISAAREARPLVCRALLEALELAEACRRDWLVGMIEEELRTVDREAYAAHVYRRARGREVSEDTTSLLRGVRETLTVLYLDLKGSTEYARAHDPGEVMMTLNQMMAELVAVLRPHDARISGFRGDGFLALLRGEYHARRAVTSALALFDALRRFNEPRTVLGLRLLEARIGIATGEAFLGNVGTYDKMDFTAIGTTANLGARLEAAAVPGLPCISRGTYELVRDRFAFKDGSPRTLALKGLEPQEVWDVVGPAAP